MCLTLFALSLATIGTHAASAPANSNDLVVDLGYAKYQGFFNETTGLNTFFGLRYAAAPTGTQRWRAPQPPQATSGILDASAMGPQCFNTGQGLALQNPFPAPGSLNKRDIASSEDCLLLNVFSPPAAQKKKLPVVFWIHGGGYEAGNADMTGEDLVHNAQDGIVAVLIQYRLGVFGFLGGAEVAKNGNVNAGLLDQQFALQWVQQHISKFGGDPNEVTIWGESAGAGSVLQHMIAHGGNTQPPLFKRAMTSSTYLPFQYQFDDVIPEKLFAQTAKIAGCGGLSDVLGCLRSLDSGALEQTNINLTESEFFGEFQYTPVIDGSLIVESPIKTITRGRLNGEVLLAITNTFEGAIFVSNQTTNGTLTDYVTNAIPTLDKTDVDRVVQIYSNIPGVNGVNAQAIAVQGEVIFICPTYFLLDAFGERSHKGEFAVPPGNHGMDVAFYFNSGGTPFNNPTFIASFSQAFSDVTVFGDPNKKVSTANKTPFWPAWSEAHTEMLFNSTEDFTAPVIHTIQTDPKLLQRCEFWKELAPKTAQ